MLPSIFGLLCGLALGLSAPLYLVGVVLSLFGGVGGGAQYARRRDALLRGLVAGAIFGAFILLGFELGGEDEAKVDLPDPHVLLLVLTVLPSLFLHWLGWRLRPRLLGSSDAEGRSRLALRAHGRRDRPVDAPAALRQFRHRPGARSRDVHRGRGARVPAVRRAVRGSGQHQGVAEQLPGEHRLRVPGGRGEGDVWIAELSVGYDDGPGNFGVSILELRDGRIVRETIYVTEGWEAPEWRARWRAAL